MNMRTRWVTRIYAGLLRLYPRRFRAEFGGEMRGVFADATEDAAAQGRLTLLALLWRELRDVPRHALCEQWRSVVARKGEAMSDGPIATNHAPVTLAETLAGTGVFVLYPFVLALGFIFTHLFPTVNLDAAAVIFSTMFWTILAGLMIALIVSWCKGFPRWSFPLWALMLIFTLYMMSVATPGLWFFGYTFGPRDLWGWRSWIPLGIVVIAYVWTRSLRPLGDLIDGVWRDWTRLSFAFYGLVPYWLLMAFDEIMGDEPVLLALNIILALGAFVYMRATQNWQRALALLVAMLVCWSAATMFAAAYWSVPHEHGLAWVTPWERTVQNMLTMGGGILAVMFAPVLLELVRRVDNAPRAA